MGHDHSHSHGHGDSAGHSHAHAGPDNQRRIGWVALLTGGFMAVEAVGGVLSGSLALLADAGHMLTDAAVAGAGVARVPHRPAAVRLEAHLWVPSVPGARGLQQRVDAVLHRAGHCFEASTACAQPAEVLGGPMLAIAVVGLVVNIAAFLVLHGADRDNLNVRGAMLHVLGDCWARWRPSWRRW